MSDLAGVFGLSGLGAGRAGVELLVRADFFPEKHAKMPVPGFGRTDDKKLAVVVLKHVPEFAAAFVEDVDGSEERKHEDGVDGVVAIEDLAEHDPAVRGPGEPGADTGRTDGPYDEPDGQAGALAHKLANLGGLAQIPVHEVAGGSHHVSGVGTARAELGAVAAVVAQPDVRIGRDFVFQTPGSPNHLLAGIRMVGRGHRAGDRTSSALIALLE